MRGSRQVDAALLRARSALLVVLALVCACGEPSRRRHPIIDDSPASTISALPVPLPGFEQLQERLSRLRRKLEFGTLDGPPETLSGLPADVAVTNSGDVLVLDAMTNDIRVYDSVGVYRRTILRRGGGPEELTDLLGLETTGASRGAPYNLVVAGRSLVKLFKLSSAGLALYESYKPPDIPFPSDLCFSPGRLVVRSAFARGADLVSSISLQSRSRIAFGTAYEHGGQMAREDLSVGPIACMPNGDVIAAFTYLPVITTYDSSGAIRWSTRLPAFTPLTFWEESRARAPSAFRPDYSEAGDMVSALHAVPGGSLIVQVVRLGESSPRDARVQAIERRITYLIDAGSGMGTYLSDSLPHVLGVTGDMIWAGEEDPSGFVRVVGLAY